MRSEACEIWNYFLRLSEEGYNRATTPEQKAKGLHGIMYSHFLPTVKVDSFQEYARHFLWAHHKYYAPEAICILINKFGLPDKPMIEDNYTDWESGTQKDWEECQSKRDRLIRMALDYVETNAEIDYSLFAK